MNNDFVKVFKNAWGHLPTSQPNILGNLCDQNDESWSKWCSKPIEVPSDFNYQVPANTNLNLLEPAKEIKPANEYVQTTPPPVKNEIIDFNARETTLPFGCKMSETIPTAVDINDVYYTWDKPETLLYNEQERKCEEAKVVNDILNVPKFETPKSPELIKGTPVETTIQPALPDNLCVVQTINGSLNAESSTISPNVTPNVASIPSTLPIQGTNNEDCGFRRGYQGINEPTTLEVVNEPTTLGKIVEKFTNVVEPFSNAIEPFANVVEQFKPRMCDASYKLLKDLVIIFGIVIFFVMIYAIVVKLDKK
jgi:hypothetical protein